MKPRAPTATLIVDANIFLSALRGRRTLAYLSRAGAVRALVTTAATREEVNRVLIRLGAGRQDIDAAAALFELVGVSDESEYGHCENAARARLVRAPASGDGSSADAHILALAWTLEADIWSHDRDFAGTGWASWSSANLVDALTDEDVEQDE